MIELDMPEGVTVWLVERTGQSGPYWKLDMVKVEPARRRQGLGREAMVRVCAAADAASVPVALSIGSDLGTPAAFLRRWYRSFGFVPNKGRRADLSISGAMVRPANQQLQGE